MRTRTTVVLISIGLASAISLLARDERPSFVLSTAVHATANEVFVPHLGEGGRARYLAMAVPFAPVEALRRLVDAHLGRALVHRGEAHITVLTPPEYADIAPYVTIEHIHALAAAANIQDIVFEVACLGRGDASLEGRVESTYFVVVESSGLRALRRQIFDAYVAGGGPPSRFDPEAWNPHITLGFTRRDLHASDGVHKGENACWADLEAHTPIGSV